MSSAAPFAVSTQSFGYSKSVCVCYSVGHGKARMADMETPVKSSENEAPAVKREDEEEKEGEQTSAGEAKAAAADTPEQQQQATESPDARSEPRATENALLSMQPNLTDDVSLTFPQRVSKIMMQSVWPWSWSRGMIPASNNSHHARGGWRRCRRIPPQNG